MSSVTGLYSLTRLWAAICCWRSPNIRAVSFGAIALLSSGCAGPPAMQLKLQSLQPKCAQWRMELLEGAQRHALVACRVDSTGVVRGVSAAETLGDYFWIDLVNGNVRPIKVGNIVLRMCSVADDDAFLVCQMSEFGQLDHSIWTYSLRTSRANRSAPIDLDEFPSRLIAGSGERVFGLFRNGELRLYDPSWESTSTLTECRSNSNASGPVFRENEPARTDLYFIMSVDSFSYCLIDVKTGVARFVEGDVQVEGSNQRPKDVQYLTVFPGERNLLLCDQVFQCSYKVNGRVLTAKLKKPVGAFYPELREYYYERWVPSLFRDRGYTVSTLGELYEYKVVGECVHVRQVARVSSGNADITIHGATAIFIDETASGRLGIVRLELDAPAEVYCPVQ